MARTRTRRPREDHGFFGPGSVVWRVWTSPTSLIGFQRAVTIETLDPFLTAAVTDSGGVRSNPRRRFDRTIEYFLTGIIGDGRSAIEASRRLHRVHEAMTGTEPVTGRPYAANDPASQLWIHVTAWHSILCCYEQFGPGRLTPDEEADYWAGCRVTAELQPIDLEGVPRSRAEVRAYFERERPRLALSHDGHDLFHYFLKPPPRRDAVALWALFRFMSFASVATMPHWMRRMAGLHQSALFDLVTRHSTRASFWFFRSLDRQLFVLDRVAPSARPLFEEAMRGAAPLHDRVVTPADARAALDPVVS